jgi:hypothetical protein
MASEAKSTFSSSQIGELQVLYNWIPPTANIGSNENGWMNTGDIPICALAVIDGLHIRD